MPAELKGLDSEGNDQTLTGEHDRYDEEYPEVLADKVVDVSDSMDPKVLDAQAVLKYYVTNLGQGRRVLLQDRYKRDEDSGAFAIFDLDNLEANKGYKSALWFFASGWGVDQDRLVEIIQENSPYATAA